MIAYTCTVLLYPAATLLNVECTKIQIQLLRSDADESQGAFRNRSWLLASRLRPDRVAHCCAVRQHPPPVPPRAAAYGADPRLCTNPFHLLLLAATVSTLNTCSAAVVPCQFAMHARVAACLKQGCPACPTAAITTGMQQAQHIGTHKLWYSRAVAVEKACWPAHGSHNCMPTRAAVQSHNASTLGAPGAATTVQSCECAYTPPSNMCMYQHAHGLEEHCIRK